MRKTLFIGMLGAIACASTLPRAAEPPVIDDGDQPVRIALTTSGENVSVGATIVAGMASCWYIDPARLLAAVPLAVSPKYAY